MRVLRAIEADHLPHRRFAPDVAPQTEQEGAIAAQAERDRWRIATWVGATLLLAIGVSVWLMLAPAPDDDAWADNRANRDPTTRGSDAGARGDRHGEHLVEL